jgi:predicted metal-binding membrane protein
MTVQLSKPDLLRSISLDRIVIIAALVIITAVSWAYLIHDAAGSNGVPLCCIRPDVRLWDFKDIAALMVMWTIMMIGMMTPTTAPMLLVFAALNRKRREQDRPYVATGLFLLGYLIVWTGFSLVATLAQWGLHRTRLMSPEMISTNRWLGAAVLIGAGIFQWTPAKNRCLTHCRSPLDFIMTEWREGPGGAVIMGLRHGISCTGCCWLLMALLFVVGVMNLLWVAAITVFVLAEKAFPGGLWIARISGAALVVWGLWTLR